MYRYGTRFAISVLVAAAGSAAGQSVWNNPAGGSWSLPSNWSPMDVPNLSTESAVLPNLGGAYAVDFDLTAEILGCTLESDATLGIKPNRVMTIRLGGMTNNGTVIINLDGSFSNATLTQGIEDTSILGTGVIELNATTTDLLDARLSASTSSTLTLGAGQLVHGSGTVQGPMVMLGAIEADRDGRDLQLTSDIDMTGGGTVRGINNGKVVLVGTLTGGTIDGGLEASGANGHISGSTSNGDNGVRPNATLWISGTGLINNGSWTVNTAGSFSDAKIIAENDIAIGGTGSIELNSTTTDIGDAQIEGLLGTTTLTLGSGQTIRGSGRVVGPIVLNGSINADRLDRNIEVVNSIDMTGGGTIGGTNGGKVDLKGQAEGGSWLGGVEATGSVASVKNAILNGANSVRQNAILAVLSNGIINRGVLTVNTDGVFSDALILASETSSIGGNGSIDLNSTTNDVGDARIETAAGQTLSIMGNQTITGSGRMIGNFVLDGTINADRLDRDLLVQGTMDMTGGGTMIGTNGGRVSMRAITTGGSWLGGVEATSATPSIDGLIASGTNGIQGSGLLTVGPAGMTNDGLFILNTNSIFNDARLSTADNITIDGVGELHLNSTSTDFNDAKIEATGVAEITIAQTQLLTGRGRLNGIFHLPGTIAPGNTIDETDTIDLIGTHDLAPTSTLEVGIAGLASTDYDRLTGNGSTALTLDGTLALSLLDGYTPNFEDRFTIIDVGVLDGQFATVISPTDGLGVFRIVQSADKIEAVWTCEADLNGDGVLDFFDVQFFLNAFTEQALYSDYNEDGVIDFFDVLAFLNDFSAGCL